MTSLMRTMAVAALFIVCGGGGGSGSGSGDNLPLTAVVPPPTPDPTGLWVQSEDAGAGLVRYAAKLTPIGAQRSATGGAVLEAAPVAGASSGGFSITSTPDGKVH